jgi:putative membrane protein
MKREVLRDIEGSDFREKDMKRSAYSRSDCRDLILRDKLAIERTLLANERTLLAYLRSGAALLIAGGSILHFAAQDWFWAMGVACIPVGIIIGIIGVGRYRRIKKSISLVRSPSEMETKEPPTPDS